MTNDNTFANENLDPNITTPETEVVQEQPLIESETTTSVNIPIKKKKFDLRKVLLVALILALVWAAIMIPYLVFLKPKEHVKLEDDVILVPKVTVLPTLSFDRYSDDYLEFEHPVGSEVKLVGGINYHPSEEGKTITGVQYLSISKPENIRLEFIYLLQGGEFPFVSIDVKTLILSTDYFNEATLEYGLKETQLTQAPEIEQVLNYPFYLVKVEETKTLYLMSLNPNGKYESVNNGAWVKLDFMGKFAEDTEWGNFIGLKCNIEMPEEYEYCKQLVYKFFETVEKKFVENEKYEKPELEAVLELRNQTTAELLDKYKFYIEDYPKGTYLKSSWNSFTVVGQDASLQFIMFEPIYDYTDISFSDHRVTPPTPDIESTEVFSNLIRGDERVVSGNQVKKSFSYRMYYPDPDKDVCYALLPPDMIVENYVGCTSYKLKVNGIDAQMQGSCTFDPDLSNASDLCDELIKS